MLLIVVLLFLSPVVSIKCVLCWLLFAWVCSLLFLCLLCNSLRSSFGCVCDSLVSSWSTSSPGASPIRRFDDLGTSRKRNSHGVYNLCSLGVNGIKSLFVPFPSCNMGQRVLLTVRVASASHHAIMMEFARYKTSSLVIGLPLKADAMSNFAGSSWLECM